MRRASGAGAVGRAFVMGAVLVGMIPVSACSNDPSTVAATVVQLPPGAPQPPSGSFHAVVERVVDGDTMLARHAGQRVRVRFIGIDSPESVKPDTPVQCWGKQAAHVTTSLLPAGSTITAAYEPGGRTDHYGRELWDIWLSDGRFAQAVIVASGAARPRAFEPQTRHASYLVEVQAVAQQAHVGLFTSCPTPSWVTAAP